MYWPLDWQHRWSMRAYEHLGCAYNCRLVSRLTDPFHNSSRFLLLMQAAISSAVADDLMAIKAHLQARPSHLPRNLVACVSWHAIGTLYHVSRWASHRLFLAALIDATRKMHFDGSGLILPGCSPTMSKNLWGPSGLQKLGSRLVGLPPL